MSAQNLKLFALHELEDSRRTAMLPESDLRALRSAAEWIQTFVAQPHKDLGRPGPVCPFVPGAIERQTLWLASERIDDRRVTEVADLLTAYRSLLLRTQPVEGDDTSYKSIVIVFTDVSAEGARELMTDSRMQDFKRRAYSEDGVVVGEFHESNDGTAIRNRSFHPFRSPVPFVLMRHAVLSDWMFFIDDDHWLGSWSQRFRESAVRALAHQLRRTHWRGTVAD